MYSDVKFRAFLTYAEQQIYKDMPCIHMLCKKNNIKAKFVNLRLTIGTKTYTHDMIHELPDELRLERAKIVPILDGVVYQGPHAFLSNLYAADVDMEVENGETITFNSNEQALAYIYSCAIHHNQHEAAQQM